MHGESLLLVPDQLHDPIRRRSDRRANSFRVVDAFMEVVPCPLTVVVPPPAVLGAQTTTAKPVKPAAHSSFIRHPSSSQPTPAHSGHQRTVGAPTRPMEAPRPPLLGAPYGGHVLDAAVLVLAQAQRGRVRQPHTLLRKLASMQLRHQGTNGTALTARA
jgi:hypothetical protein